MLDGMSLDKLKVILAALQCCLSVEHNKSEIVHDPNNIRPYFTEGRITGCQDISPYGYCR